MRLTDEIRKYIGMQTAVQRVCDPVEAGAVRRQAQAIMDHDPIYMSKQAAAGTRYKQPVAPPLFPNTMMRLLFVEPDVIQERANDPGFDGGLGSRTLGLPPLPIARTSQLNGGTQVELIGLHRGPLTMMHLMRWAATTENWRRIHCDQKFAVEQQKLPGPLVSGTFKEQFILQLLKDWAKVQRKIPLAAYGLVELELGIKNMEGRESTPGFALVALAYREWAPVPYPFVPPEVDPFDPFYPWAGST